LIEDKRDPQKPRHHTRGGDLLGSTLGRNQRLENMTKDTDIYNKRDLDRRQKETHRNLCSTLEEEPS